MRWRVFTLRLPGYFTDDRLKLEQLHLRLRKFFSACSICTPDQRVCKRCGRETVVIGYGDRWHEHGGCFI